MSDTSLVPLDAAPVTWNTLKAIAATEFVPKGMRGRPEAMLAAVLAGRELGLGPMASIRGIDMIEGSPHLSGETIMALVRRAGHRIRITKMDRFGATVVGERLNAAGEVVESCEFSFLEEDAKAAGLLEKNNWKNYRATMMAWRAITQCGRFLFADLLGSGVKLTYTADELGDSGEPEPVIVEPEVLALLPSEVEIAEIVEDAEVETVGRQSLTITKPRGRPDAVKEALAALKKMGDPLAVPSVGVPADYTNPEIVAEAAAEKPASFSELTALTGTFHSKPEQNLVGWDSTTADGLERNTRRIYELMSGLGIWQTKGGEADPFHAGLERFGVIARRDPGKWDVDVNSLRGDPLQHWGSLGKKQNMQAFAAITVTWAEARLEKGKP